MLTSARKFIDWLIPDRKIADEAFAAVGSPLAATIPVEWLKEDPWLAAHPEEKEIVNTGITKELHDGEEGSLDDAANAFAFLSNLRREGASGAATFGSITAGRVVSKNPNPVQARKPVLVSDDYSGGAILNLMKG